VTDLNQALRTSGEYQPGQVINITVWRNGQTIVLRNVKLGNITVLYLTTNQTVIYPYLGVESVSYQGLRSLPETYSTLYDENPLLYITEMPTSPTMAVYVPFSGLMNGFYTSPFGGATLTITNLLFWLFFVNINLAIFNSLPIYPMDGGQAFEYFLKDISKGRLSKKTVERITIAVTLAIVFTFLAIIVGPYLITSHRFLSAVSLIPFLLSPSFLLYCGFHRMLESKLAS
jgi:membrane-associated protease RseP (regulator of RpoE activity)